MGALHPPTKTPACQSLDPFTEIKQHSHWIINGSLSNLLESTTAENVTPSLTVQVLRTKQTWVIHFYKKDTQIISQSVNTELQGREVVTKQNLTVITHKTLKNSDTDHCKKAHLSVR